MKNGSQVSLLKNESQTSIEGTRKPIASALYLQNINPIKAAQKKRDAEREAQDLIVGGGDKVEIETRNDVTSPNQQAQ